jgi:4-diphosphocytidyl-2-C-methyl-D-erythritol kinase
MAGQALTTRFLLTTRSRLTTRARAKINLSLRVIGRREDGYHALESLVAFAGIGDELRLVPGEALALGISGPMAAGLTVSDDNLVLKAAHALADAVPGLTRGTFHLVKRLPVASGIGGGSADAAAALRLLARANAIAADDERLFAAARAVGADVPVCLMSRSVMMRGVGETLERIALPRLFALLINPGIGLSTAAVFGEMGLARGQGTSVQSSPEFQVGAAQLPVIARSASDEAIQTVDGLETRTGLPRRASRPPRNDGEAFSGSASGLLPHLANLGNDLEPPALRLAPVISDVLAALRAQHGCRLARMSGSGATCFALFDDCRASASAGKRLARQHPGWWIRPTVLN